MISSEQSRAARGWLNWSQEELAKRARVAVSTVRDFEKGRRTPVLHNLEAIMLALAEGGARPTFRNGAPAGVEFSAPRPGDAGRTA